MAFSSTEPSVTTSDPVDEDGLTIVDPRLKLRQAAPEERSAEVRAVVVSPEPTREKLRVLFVTYEDVFSEHGYAARRYIGYSTLYEEVHIIVPTLTSYTFDVMQLAENVWAYPTHGTKWWMHPYDVYTTATRQLFFGGSFRPDVVVASDPFENGGIAWLLARRFKRAFVVEATENMYDDAFLDESDDNSYRAWLAGFVVPRAERVVVRSAHARDVMLSHIPLLKGRIDVVMKGHDVDTATLNAAPDMLKSKFPRCNFFMVVIAPLNGTSGVASVIEAASFTLRQYTTFGLVVVGDGPERAALHTLAREKGVASNVFFESMTSDCASYLRGAQIALVPKATRISEEVLSTAALLHVPVIIGTEVVAGDIFVNGESAVVCADKDLGCVIKGISTYVNDTMIRTRYAKEAGRRAQLLAAEEAKSGGVMLATLREAVFSYYEKEDGTLSMT